MKNVFSNELSGFAVIFQCLSLFPYSNNPIWNLLLKFYSAINLAVIAYIIASAFFIQNVTESEDSVSSLVTSLVLTGLIIAHFVNKFQSLLSYKEQLCIYQTFDEIDYIFQHQLLVNIRYQNIRKYLWQKFITIAIILISIKIIFIYYSGDYFLYSMYTLLSITVLQMRCFQTIFYVDLINGKLTQLNKHIADVADKNVAIISHILMTAHPHKSSVDNVERNQFICDQILALKQIYGNFMNICSTLM